MGLHEGKTSFLRLSVRRIRRWQSRHSWWKTYFGFRQVASQFGSRECGNNLKPENKTWTSNNLNHGQENVQKKHSFWNESKNKKNSRHIDGIFSRSPQNVFWFVRPKEALCDLRRSLTKQQTKRSPSSGIHCHLLLWQREHRVNGWKMSLTNKHYGALLSPQTQGAVEWDIRHKSATKSHSHLKVYKEDILNTRLCSNLTSGGRPDSLGNFHFHLRR